MSKCFRVWDVDQVWPLPPSVHDFVPAGHPAHLVRELVRSELDLAAIMADDEREERGRRARRVLGHDGQRPAAARPGRSPARAGSATFTAPDSRLLKTRDGVVPSYNGQIVVDPAHQIIVAPRLTTNGSNQGTACLPAGCRQGGAQDPATWRRARPATARPTPTAAAGSGPTA